MDQAVTVGQVYSYTVRSYDPAGNLHGAADEVSAVPFGATSWTYLPVVVRAQH